ncbi:leucine-rich repeat domain-containing protein [Hymenobacter baengnokdamensis]|uniref:leucine-rich repeat domain-containing protein n=1 Tax=Hymenobacter baengnokdamensis TaxID=2615203 RepID=UPI001246E598|nr:leucine-rich repeat domain-containing protein [Hymenobacter baengnokdamensis]
MKIKSEMSFFEKVSLYFATNYTDINLVLHKPQKVQRLSVQFWEGDTNSYADDFIRFKNLKELNIQTGLNHPSFLPSQIGELKKLKKLSILNVPFKEFPTWIQNLVELEYLSIRGCELTEIPRFIGRLRNLKELRVENCELDSIPKELSLLDKVKYLSLADTKITYFPLENLPPNIKSLGLGGPIFGYTVDELCRLKKALPHVRIWSIIDTDCN